MQLVPTEKAVLIGAVAVARSVAQHIKNEKAAIVDVLQQVMRILDPPPPPPEPPPPEIGFHVKEAATPYFIKRPRGKAAVTNER